MRIHKGSLHQWVILTTVHPDILHTASVLKEALTRSGASLFLSSSLPKAQHYPSNVCYNNASLTQIMLPF